LTYQRTANKITSGIGGQRSPAASSQAVPDAECALSSHPHHHGAIRQRNGADRGLTLADRDAIDQQDPAHSITAAGPPTLAPDVKKP